MLPAHTESCPGLMIRGALILSSRLCLTLSLSAVARGTCQPTTVSLVSLFTTSPHARRSPHTNTQGSTVGERVHRCFACVWPTISSHG